ncbi:hypothetical protein [Mycolicibacterium agri]|uniref:hypothetical protein n=1 Tax=Mycolicibacterium agri TaxID=36811 RepID=UPI0013D0C0D0|nr:hypothetical protein [Mycolicibacterium agri]
MAVSTVLTALAGLTVLLAVVAIGVLMVSGGRGRDRHLPGRVRRFISDRRRDGRGP